MSAQRSLAALLSEWKLTSLKETALRSSKSTANLIAATSAWKILQKSGILRLSLTASNLPSSSTHGWDANRAKPRLTVRKVWLKIGGKHLLWAVAGTRQKLRWEVTTSMANEFSRQKFTSRKACEKLLSQFFVNRYKAFYKSSNVKLSSKCQ